MVGLLHREGDEVKGVMEGEWEGRARGTGERDERR